MKNAYSFLIAGSFFCLLPSRSNAGSSSESAQTEQAQRRYSKTSGELEKIDLPQNKIILKNHEGASVSYNLASVSDIKLDGKEVAAGKLRAGQRVRLLRFDSSTHSIKRLDVSTK